MLAILFVVVRCDANSKRCGVLNRFVPDHPDSNVLINLMEVRVLRFESLERAATVASKARQTAVLVRFPAEFDNDRREGSNDNAAYSATEGYRDTAFGLDARAIENHQCSGPVQSAVRPAAPRRRSGRAHRRMGANTAAIKRSANSDVTHINSHRFSDS